MNNFNCIGMPGGERHVTYSGKQELSLSTPRQTIVSRGLVTPDKLIEIGMAAEIYARTTGKNPNLVLPYIPGGRQDRVTIPEVSFSLTVYSNIIGSFPIYELITVDPHSIATPLNLSSHGLGSRIRIIKHQDWFLKWIEGQTFAPGLHKFLFPDAGAEAKYSQVPAYTPFKSCRKVRDPLTGKLSGFEVPDLRSWEDNFIWIVDDICDGGGTFIGIAEKVREQLGNKCNLGLAVSHGIFSNQENLREFSKLFNYIVTTDSVFLGIEDTGIYSSHLVTTGVLQVQLLGPILKEMGIYD